MGDQERVLLCILREINHGVCGQADPVKAMEESTSCQPLRVTAQSIRQADRGRRKKEYVDVA